MQSIPSISRFLRAPKQSFFLLGPRGTGKSTWLKQQFPGAIWIDLLEPDNQRYYGAKPERLRETLKAHSQNKQVVIDEIQRIPELLSLIHAIIEEKQEYQFILTGSSARKLKRAGVDLLAGRAFMLHMHPFMASELKEYFSLEKALTEGLLPLVWDSETPHLVLKNYCGLYLKEEIQAEGLVRNIHNYERFLEAISFSHGSQLNTSNIARECDVSRNTIDTYLQILIDMLLAFTLPVFAKRAKREVVKHPKFYLFDSGIYHAVRPKGPIDKPEEIGGPSLEGVVASHLRAWIDLQQDEYQLSFWRTRTQLEVDFIVYGANEFCAIEVKNSESISPKDLHGLLAFSEEYPEAKPLLLYRGTKRRFEKGILILPCEEYLKALHPEKTLFEKDF
ncbi:MAG: AAA family ATPase [Parachlamydia sp.]|nr:AAA family ATPase [Parachlamydia sp.]